MKNFTQIPNTLLRNPKIKNGPFRLLSVLWSYKYKHNDVFVSQSTLAKDLGVNLRTITGWLSNLKKLELVNWKKRIGRSNLYSFNMENFFVGGEKNKETIFVSDTKDNVTNYGKNFPTNNTKKKIIYNNTDFRSSKGYESCVKKANEWRVKVNQRVDNTGK